MDTINSTATDTTTTTGRGVCCGCGETTKALQAPRPNVGQGYHGAMYCQGCNPRFSLFSFDRDGAFEEMIF